MWTTAVKLTLPNGNIDVSIRAEAARAVVCIVVFTVELPLGAG